MPRQRKYTRILKTTELIAVGVPVEAIPTYCALADHASNETGLCWPKMETLASTLGKSVRTIQRHLQALREAAVVEFVERRRWRGRFSSYLYRIVHYANFARARTTGHRGPVETRSLYKNRTKPLLNTEKATENLEEKRRREAERRSEGFEWWFE